MFIRLKETVFWVLDFLYYPIRHFGLGIVEDYLYSEKLFANFDSENFKLI